MESTNRCMEKKNKDFKVAPRLSTLVLFSIEKLHSGHSSLAFRNVKMLGKTTVK